MVLDRCMKDEAIQYEGKDNHPQDHYTHARHDFPISDWHSRCGFFTTDSDTISRLNNTRKDAKQNWGPRPFKSIG